MAFNTAPGRAEYTASAAQTIFTFTFKIFETSNVKVYLTPAGQAYDDATDILIETTDYTVSINGDDGGDVTLTSGATLNDRITLVRELPTDRDIEYQHAGDLTAAALNEDQDYQTYLILDGVLVKERALTIPDSVQSFDTEIPSPVANKLLLFNAFATGFDLLDPASTGIFKDSFIVDNIAALGSIDPNIYSSVIVRGYYVANDGGGGLFNYDATQSAVNNGVTIINGWVRQYSGAIDAKWAGASTVLADNSSYIQAAIDISDLVEITDTFNIETQIDLRSGVRLSGGGALDFSAVTATFKALSSLGSYGASTTLTSDGSELSNTLDLTDASAYSIGDVLMVFSDAVSGSTNQKLGEFVTIESIATNTITLRGALNDDYLTADSAGVKLVNFMEDIEVKDLSFIGPTDNTLHITGISNNIVRNVNIDNCSFLRTQYAGVSNTDTMDFKVTNSSFKDFTLAGLAYGVTVGYCTSNGAISNNFADNMRHFVTTGGGSTLYGKPRFIVADSNTMINMSDAGLDVHPGGDNIIFSNNSIHCGGTAGSGDGITIQGTNCVVSNNTISGAARQGILCQMSTTKPANVIITGNKIIADDSGIILELDNTAGEATSVISNNIAYGNVHGLYLTEVSASEPKNLIITGNSFSSDTNSVINFIQGINDSVVANNILEPINGGEIGIYALNSNRVGINNNIIRNITTGITVVSCQSTTINGNTAINSITGISIKGGSEDVTISDNKIITHSSFGIYVYADTASVKNISILNNSINGGSTDPVRVRSLTGFKVSQMNLRNNKIEVIVGEGIYLLGTDADSIENINLVGNITDGGGTKRARRLINCNLIYKGENIDVDTTADSVATSNNLTQNTVEAWV